MSYRIYSSLFTCRSDLVCVCVRACVLLGSIVSIHPSLYRVVADLFPLSLLVLLVLVRVLLVPPPPPPMTTPTRTPLSFVIVESILNLIHVYRLSVTILSIGTVQQCIDSTWYYCIRTDPKLDSVKANVPNQII